MLTCVMENVGSQLRQLNKSLTTVLAAVRFVSCVCAHVPVQGFLGGEFSVTLKEIHR